MSYVEPNSVIQLMHIDGLDNRYMHTLYFASVAAQTTFMNNKVGVSLENNSYQRLGRGYIKIKKRYDEVYTYNYMRFQNTRNGDSKWYYAFITAVEYVNENTTYITYQIDVMQTWFIGASCNACLVEREHSSTDVWGENLESEPVGSDIYDYDEVYSDPHLTTDYSLVITMTGMNRQYITAPDQVVAPADFAGYTDGLFNGAWTTAMHIDGATLADKVNACIAICNTLWRDIKGDWNTSETPIEVLNMKMFPTDYTSGATQAFDVPVQAQPRHYVHTFARPTSYDNFTPQNKKMLTYPFSFLVGTTGDGDTQQLKWEYFDGGYGADVEIESYACSIGAGEIIYAPKDYNGELLNLDNKMVINNFPYCPFSYDAYQAWLAAGGDIKAKTQRNFKIAGSVINAMGNAVGIASAFDTESTPQEPDLSGYTRDIHDTSKIMLSSSSMADMIKGAANNAPAAASGITGVEVARTGIAAAGSALNIAEAVTKCKYAFKDAKYQPRVVVGDSTSSVMVGNGLLATKFYHSHIRDDEAKRVDEFFTMYGYATNRVKVPNFTGRQYWNFVKTKGASIRGNMPATAMAAIADILDGGINFWHGDYIGNYNVGISGGVITNPIV